MLKKPSAEVVTYTPKSKCLTPEGVEAFSEQLAEGEQLFEVSMRVVFKLKGGFSEANQRSLLARDFFTTDQALLNHSLTDVSLIGTKPERKH